MRVRRGAYADAGTWTRIGPDGRYRALVGAAARLVPGGVFSHHSAAVMHRLPTIDGWPDKVHQTVPRSGGGRSTARTIRHTVQGDIPSVVIDGVTVTTLERTVVDLACVAPFGLAVAVADCALRRGVERAALLGELASRVGSRGVARASNVLQFANPLAESPGESLMRATMHQLGFPVPALQVALRDAGGLIGVVDFLWEAQSLIGEFDGMVKYHREEYRNGGSAEDVLVQEKLREDRLRATGRGMTRVVWRTLTRPGELAAQLRAAGLPQR